MGNTLIREELVELSVMRAISLGLPDYGYVPTDSNGGNGGNVHIREAFPTVDERNSDLNVTTVAFGFNIDDGGEPAELGTSLTRYVHTLLCWVFATEPRFGRRLAHTLKHVARRNLDILPLYDFNDPAEPIIDAMGVQRVQTRHEANQSPRPWDRYVWTTAIAVMDISYPAMGA